MTNPCRSLELVNLEMVLRAVLCWPFRPKGREIGIKFSERLDSMAGRYGDLAYSKATKRSLLFGISLFLIGVLREATIHTTGVQVLG